MLAIECSFGALHKKCVVPEGFDDVVVESGSAIDLIQVKSRSACSSLFSNSEISNYGKKLDGIFQAVNSNEVKVRGTWIILERPSSSGDWLSWPSFIKQLSSSRELQSNKHILVLVPDPKSIAVTLLEKKLQVIPAVAEIIFNYILIFCGLAATENTGRSYRERYRIAPNEINNLKTKLLKIIDSSLLDEAIRSGVCSPISFESKLDNNNFYHGVNAEPGHIAAGLAISRPDLINEVCDQIVLSKTVLIAGPSGSGKSALQWMCVKNLYNGMRWFRVSQLGNDKDAASVLSMIEGLQPSSNSPIGVVFDDIGKYDTGLFKAVTREIQSRKNVVVLGSIRNEDLPELGDLSGVEIIQISLDEELAGAIWGEINSELETEWEYWREPFELSEGLLLEYMHILTQGRRFSEVIDGQIATRTKENRHDELAVIRICSTAFSMGGHISAKDLQNLLGLQAEELFKALERLLNEHLIRFSSPGVICGLHDLRSEALFKRSHDDVVYLKEASISLALGCVTTESIPYVIQRVIGLNDNGSHLEALAKRLTKKPNVKEWNSVVTGLGFASLSNLKNCWVKILEKRELEPAHWPIATMMACADSELDGESSALTAFSKVNGAVKEFALLNSLDYRASLLSKIPESYKIEAVDDIEDLVSLYSSMGPLPGIGVAGANQLNIGGHILGDLEQVCTLLDAARAIGVDVAQENIERLGGSCQLVDKFFNQKSWITRPTITFDSSRMKVVSSDMYILSEQQPKDTHEEIVKLCGELFSIIPDADRVEVKAIDIEGNELMAGDYPVATKSIPRENFPSFTAQRWNQNFISLVVNQTASGTETEYASLMKNLVIKTEEQFKGFLEAWCRTKDKTYLEKNELEIQKIIDDSKRYSFQSNIPINIGAKPVNGGVEFNDPVSELVGSVSGNLIPRLCDREDNCAGLAAFTVSLIELHQAALDATYWRLLKWDVSYVLCSINQQLTWLKAILCESANNKKFLERINSISKKSSRNNALRLCAANATELANRRFDVEKKSVLQALLGISINARIEDLPAAADKTYLWPAKELFIVVEVDSIEQFLLNSEEILIAVASRADPFRRTFIMPIKNCIYIPQFAFSSLSEQFYPLLEIDERVELLIERYKFDGILLNAFNLAIRALSELSGISTVFDLSCLRPEEVDAFNEAVSVVEKTEAIFEEAIEKSGRSILIEALELIETLRYAVAQQNQDDSSEFCPNLARSQLKLLNGTWDVVMEHIIETKVELVDYEINETLS